MITYEDKVALEDDVSIADKNKVKAEDMNEIKSVVNSNKTAIDNSIQSINTNIGNLDNLTTFNKDSLVNAINNITETGSNDNGSWIKYADGTMICMCTKGYTITTPNKLGSSPLFYGYRSLTDFPQSFIERPYITYTLFSSGDVFCIQPYSLGSGQAVSNSNAGGVYPIGGSSNSQGLSINISYIAIGKWK